MIAAVALAAALASSGAPAAPDACAATVHFRGRGYLGRILRRPLHAAARAGRGERPGCNDVVMCDTAGNCQYPNNPPRPVRVWRIRGIPTRNAVLLSRRSDIVYIHVCLRVQREAALLRCLRRRH